MSRRDNDRDGADFTNRRKPSDLPVSQQILHPGFIMIPVYPTAIGAVTASSVVVTVFDVQRRVGGLCHFVKPRTEKDERPTAMCGLAAVAFLLRTMLERARPDNLRAGVYGGAAPDWATPDHREMARENVNLARRMIRRRNVTVDDEDVGGHRGRKLVYHTGLNEIVILKTDNIRKSDWFVHL
jgi:chemotaxis protein CheD